MTRGRVVRVEDSGRTVEEAVQRALEKLGVGREDVEVEVLDEGSRGVFGIGAREARVLVAIKGGAAEAVQELAEDMLGLMGFDARIAVEESHDGVRVALYGENLGGLIGRYGQTLAACESLLTLMTGRMMGGSLRVELDVEGYRERRRSALEMLARRTAERVVRQRREIALNPMEARERRIIHVTLQDDPVVTTISRGEGALRRVVVMPRSVGGSREDGRGESAESVEQFSSRLRSPSRVESEGRAGRGQRWERRRGTGRQRQAPETRPGTEGTGSASGMRERESQAQRPGDRQGGGRVQRGHGSSPSPAKRPEGLPIDEELEVEIEEHLGRNPGESSFRKDAGGQPPQAGPSP